MIGGLNMVHIFASVEHIITNAPWDCVESDVWSQIFSDLHAHIKLTI